MLFSPTLTMDFVVLSGLHAPQSLLACADDGGGKAKAGQKLVPMEALIGKDVHFLSDFEQQACREIGFGSLFLLTCMGDLFGS